MMYVLAEDYGHFVYWCKISGLVPNTDAKYVQDEVFLQGRKLGLEDTIIRYETHRNHPRYHQIIEYVAVLESLRDNRPVISVRRRSMWTWIFWKQAIERSIRAFAATLLSLITTDAVNVISSGTLGKLLTALGAAIVSILISVTASNMGDKSSPSLVSTE